MISKDKLGRQKKGNRLWSEDPKIHKMSLSLKEKNAILEMRKKEEENK